MSHTNGLTIKKKKIVKHTVNLNTSVLKYYMSASPITCPEFKRMGIHNLSPSGIPGGKCEYSTNSNTIYFAMESILSGLTV